MIDAIDKAIDFYLLDERVYQNYIAPKNFNKKFLLESRKTEDLNEIILNVGFLKTSEILPHMLHFTHQYYRDYFAARHIVNILEAICVSYKDRPIEEIQEIIRHQKLDSVWFFDSESHIYRLIGEICGDYKNADLDCDFWYNKTVLDDLLDIYREFNCTEDFFGITENVMNVMKQARNGVICNVNFERLPLPNIIYCDMKFSRNGEFPCSFRNCKIVFIEILREREYMSFDENDFPYKFFKWEEFAVFSHNKRYILMIMSYYYAILWDNVKSDILWDKNLQEDNFIFDFAEFSADDTQVTLFTYNGYDCRKNSSLTYNLKGELVDSNMRSYRNYDYDEDVKIEEELKLKIISKLDHFRNCDFQGAEFLEEDYKKLLKIMGAII